MSSAPKPPTAPATARRPRGAPTAPRWRSAGRRRGRAKAALAGARRGSSPACAVAPAPRRRADRPLRRAGDAQRPPHSTPTAPASPAASCGSSPARRAARSARVDVERPSPTGDRGGFELRLAPGPSRRVTVAFAGDERLDAGAPALARAAGPRRRLASTAAPPPLSTGEAVQLGGRVAQPRRADPRAAASWSRSSTWSGRPAAGARCSSPAPITRAASTPATASATSPAPPGSGCGRRRWPEERWPYAPGSSPPVTVEVSG